MRASVVLRMPRERRVAVSALNLRKTAARVLGYTLVSPEVEYIQRTLAKSVTQTEMDASVLAVRKMPWATIMPPE
jgi:hypothetical protein